ncbi:hypothetical protein PIROE2DRAFT_16811 [Piromyces sp. E2]|nr:hypothetical protein PIROE2DRAFT_16811 [Piromyces sp. E2]|eukprot:OUM58033.1 hypothetical protein PIROE2DRAFT_16811 [Piromyces sp. E2]
MIIEDSNTYEEAPELFSESIIQMHNELKNSPLYPESQPKKAKETKIKGKTKTKEKTKEKTVDNIPEVENNNTNNSFSFISEVSPGNLIPYDEDIEKKLNDLSCSSASSILNENINNISLDPDYNLLDYNNK